MPPNFPFISRFKGLNAKESVAVSTIASHSMRLKYWGLKFGKWQVVRGDMKLKRQAREPIAFSDKGEMSLTVTKLSA